MLAVAKRLREERDLSENLKRQKMEQRNAVSIKSNLVFKCIWMWYIMINYYDYLCILIVFFKDCNDFKIKQGHLHLSTHLSINIVSANNRNQENMNFVN